MKGIIADANIEGPVNALVETFFRSDESTASTGGYISVTLGTLKLTSGSYTTNYAGTANSLAGLQVNSLTTATMATLAMSSGATLTSPIIYIGRLAGDNATATLGGFGTTLTSVGQFTVGSRTSSSPTTRTTSWPWPNCSGTRA